MQSDGAIILLGSLSEPYKTFRSTILYACLTFWSTILVSLQPPSEGTSETRISLFKLPLWRKKTRKHLRLFSYVNCVVMPLTSVSLWWLLAALSSTVALHQLSGSCPSVASVTLPSQCAAQSQVHDPPNCAQEYGTWRTALDS